MLTGKAPLIENEPAVAGERQAEGVSPRPQPVSTGLTVGSARLIKKMMSKAPGERYQKWEGVIADLTSLLYFMVLR